MKGWFEQGADLAEIFQHVRANVGFAVAAPVPDEDDFFSQYQWSETESLPLYASIRKVLANEWKDVEK